jgi:hypothetical protein
MKILFLCGSAEPGKDGVGDYIRRLCGELNRTGHEAQILSLCDKEVSVFLTQIQVIEKTAVTVRRIPIASSYNVRLGCAQKVVKEVAPDWISLQFVSYGFHPKGLVSWMPKFLMQLNGTHQWHLMFHELWIGIEKQAPLKNKLVGLLQKKLIREIHRSIKPQVVHTQAKIYQYYLGKINIKAQYLPLFGNVCVSAIKDRESEVLIFVVFATIHDNVPFEDFIVDLKESMREEAKEVKFIFIGRNGDLLSSWTQILDKYSVIYELLGPTTESQISQVLMNGNYGISSTPYKISDKSGVLAAMREHQLPVINIAKPWVDQDDIAISFSDIAHYQKGRLFLKTDVEKVNNSLSEGCANFLESINYLYATE